MREDAVRVRHILEGEKVFHRCIADAAVNIACLQNRLDFRAKNEAVIMAVVVQWLFAKTITRQEKRLLSSCLLYTSPSPRDRQKSRMPSSA